MKRSTGIVLVVVAAALWGTDALFRRPLAQSTSVVTIVFGEHLVLVAITLPLVVPALIAVWRAGPRYLLAAIGVGAGASALATILFTQAFVDGGVRSIVTVVMVQKVQPLVAVLGAAVVLGERPRPRFGLYLLAALVGTWLIAFSSPTNVDVHGALVPVLYALAAAVLWALGTVLGRYLTQKIRFEHVATLRFTFGLVASGIALVVMGGPAFASAHDSLWIAILALVTGALALGLYYYGLRSTPAVAATLGELAFPITAAVVGFAAFGATLTPTQWLGVAVTSLVVILLPVRPRDTVEHVPGQAPAPAPAPA